MSPEKNRSIGILLEWFSFLSCRDLSLQINSCEEWTYKLSQENGEVHDPWDPENGFCVFTAFHVLRFTRRRNKNWI